MLLQNPVRATVQKLQTPDLDRRQFNTLCAWIEQHLDEPIGWQQLIEHTDMEYQTIQALFFKFESTTPMTWIRRQRQAKAAMAERGRPILTLAKWKSDQWKAA